MELQGDEGHYRAGRACTGQERKSRLGSGSAGQEELLQGVEVKGAEGYYNIVTGHIKTTNPFSQASRSHLSNLNENQPGKSDTNNLKPI